MRRVSVLVALGAATVSFAACGPDPFAPKANVPVRVTTFTVWAITGSPAPYPTAFSVQHDLTLRLEPDGLFDVAFDITPDGKLQVLPVKAVVSPVGGSRAVGVQVATVPYAQITEAPRNGWSLDSTVEVVVGQTFLLQVTSNQCAFSGSQTIYAKLVADSIFPAERRAFLSGRINQNCGFRSFADGIPEF